MCYETGAHSPVIMWEQLQEPNVCYETGEHSPVIMMCDESSIRCPRPEQPNVCLRKVHSLQDSTLQQPWTNQKQLDSSI